MARLMLVAVLVLGPLGLGGRAEAATFTVASTEDMVDALPGDGLCATATGTCTLRAAVQETNSLGGTNTVLLPAGTYTLTIPGADEDLAATGDLDIMTDLTVTGADRSSTIIDGNGLDRVFHHLDLFPTSTRFVLSHVTVRNGTASQGAAIASYAMGELALSDCTITENHGDDAVFADSSGFAMSDIEVSRNTGTGMVLGGPGTLQAVTVTANGGTGIDVQADTTLTDGLIADNGGAGLSDLGEGSIVPVCNLLQLTHTRVLRNGRGIVLGTECNLFCTDCVIADNSGDGIGSDGGMYLEDSSVTGNGGGGIFAGGHGANLYGVTLSGNHNTFPGGAMFISTFVLHEDGSTDAEPVIIDRTTISGNSADGGGGGVFRDRGALVISNSTIVGNTATTGSGGGIAIVDNPFDASPPAPTTIENTIVGGNGDGSGGAPDCAGALVSNGHNLIQSLAGCSLTGDLASSIFGRDPLLGPLTDNGGPTLTRALLAGSPAIDAGPATCGDVDQRGRPRPQFVTCDIGAYEFAPACSPPFPAKGSCQTADPERSRLLLKDDVDPTRSKLTWKWRNSGPATKADFGSPTSSTDVTWCIGDDAGNILSSAVAPAGGICFDAPCWREMNAGFSYKDRDLSPQGIQGITLRAAPSGAGRLSVKGKGKGLNLSMPALPMTPPVTVRLARSDSPICWEATFSSPRRNDGQQFTAKSD